MSFIGVASIHALSSLTRVQLDTVPDFKVHRAGNVCHGSGRADDARGGLGNADSLDEVPGPVLSPPKDRRDREVPCSAKPPPSLEGCGVGGEGRSAPVAETKELPFSRNALML